MPSNLLAAGEDRWLEISFHDKLDGGFVTEVSKNCVLGFLAPSKEALHKALASSRQID